MNKKFPISVLMGWIGLSAPAYADMSHCSLYSSDSASNAVEIRRIEDNITSAIKQSESKFDRNRRRTLSCLLEVLPDGSISDLKILSSSGSKKRDTAVLSTLKNATFKPYSTSLGPRRFVIKFLSHRDLHDTSSTVDFFVTPSS
ncbi:MAG: TonB family protein [Cyanobacteria bacterium SZAS-4]|nr:TonB family protein [Cyanobacteria bacterium SZAS-4]